MYGSGSANVEMENREKTCLLHWSTSLHRHMQKYIKEALQQQHITLCKQYKDLESMDQAEVRYFAIRSWWLSSGAAVEEALHHLDHWLAFWHFRYRQWGASWTWFVILFFAFASVQVLKLILYYNVACIGDFRNVIPFFSNL